MKQLFKITFMVFCLYCVPSLAASKPAPTLHLQIINQTDQALVIGGAGYDYLDITTPEAPIAPGTTGAIELKRLNRLGYFAAELSIQTFDITNLLTWSTFEINIQKNNTRVNTAADIWLNHNYDYGAGKLNTKLSNTLWDGNSDATISIIVTNKRAAVINASPSNAKFYVENKTKLPLSYWTQIDKGAIHLENFPVPPGQIGTLTVFTDTLSKFKSYGRFSTSAQSNSDGPISTLDFNITVPNTAWFSHGLQFSNPQDFGAGYLYATLSAYDWNGLRNTSIKLEITKY